MKTLVVYYSRTKTSEKLAKNLADKLDAGLEEVIDRRDYSGALGYIAGGRDALMKKEGEIEELKNNARDYDLVIIVTPVWAGNMVPGIRSFIRQEKDVLGDVVFIATQGSSREQKVFRDLEEEVGRGAVVQEFFTTKEIQRDEFGEKLDELVGEIRGLEKEGEN